MLATQPTGPQAPCQDPFRWSRADIATTLDDFANHPDSSQRHYANAHAIPQATFNYWNRHYAPDPDDPRDAFFRSPAGDAVLRRILTAALLVFQQRGACGLRLVADFLHLAQLD